MKILFLIVFAYIISTVSISAQPGSLDPSFANNGIFTSQINTSWDEAKALTVQEDGKIVTAGYIDQSGADPATGDDFYIRRFNTDGSPDLDFGEDGIVIQDLSGGADGAWDVEIQSDGKIVAAGFGWQSWERALVMRLNQDGTLDDSFGDAGMAVIEIGGFTDRIWDIEIQPDGKIVGCGTCFVSGSNFDWCALRLHTNGNLDTTFGDDGVLSLDLGDQQVSAEALAILDDERILMGGYSNSSGPYAMQFAMLNSDGTLDETWGEEGLVQVVISGADDALKSIAIQPDGKIVGGGYSWNGSNYDYALVRLNPDGSLDESFDGDGLERTSIGEANDAIEDIYIRPNGKILAGGYSEVEGSVFDWSLAMYNPDGSLEEGFGTDGKVIAGISDGWDTAFGIEPSADGNILTAGFSDGGDEIYELTLAMFLDQFDLGIVGQGEEEKLLVYPNPIASSTTLRFELKTKGKYSVKLLDLSGQLIAEIIPERSFHPGQHELLLEMPKDLPFGNYLIRFASSSESIVVKIAKQ